MLLGGQFDPDLRPENPMSTLNLTSSLTSTSNLGCGDPDLDLTLTLTLPPDHSHLTPTLDLENGEF